MDFILMVHEEHLLRKEIFKVLELQNKQNEVYL